MPDPRTVTLAEVRATLDAAYPPALAEDWDTGIGLTCGDPAQPVGTVLLAVDVDPVTVDEAVEVGADLLLTHHPLLFRPVQSVAADTAKGRLIHRLIRGGVAHLAAHTNADRAAGGVNDALAAALGLTDTRPVAPADADPALGLGRIGTLAAPTTARAFAAAIAAALPATVTGARLAGDPDRRIRRVAVCGGSGGSLLSTVSGAGVDAFVTSDLGHHVAQEYVSGGDDRPVLVDVAHWAGEWPWLPVAAALLERELGVRAVVSERRTDPWTARA
ncbi:Nif3-like dinuclear metal center hexameric protein [Nakamurella deserti]|uniref:Nif3-like dinuclear metal center hexameric protein n=1 Tax=Nakamurella deserti TaxID=2164074 RepID=UPI000DBE5AB8|nr:Nif3-like dinuclear metal center hexameric protein [Nakamurella deserti]